MPRERVQHGKLFVTEEHPGTSEHPGAILMREYRQDEAIPTGAILREQPSIDVTWNRDPGWVQVSIEAPTDWWDNFDRGRRESERTDGHYRAVTEVLARDEINHMIRTLRRARDAAYGADE